MVHWTMSQQAAKAVSFRFRRPNPHGGLIQILNENSYLLAEYNENTGVVSWHRMVVATQKTTIEQRLFEQFPIRGTKQAAKSSKN